jgi:hypothetical protein
VIVSDVLSATTCVLTRSSGSLYNLTVANCSAFQGDITTLLPEPSPQIAPALILGGGVYCISSSVYINNSVFLYNAAVNGSGGGIAVGPQCAMSCIGCTFSHNSAHLGAGLHLQSQGALIMNNSTVSSNIATDFSSCGDYGSASSLCYGKGAGIHASISYGFSSSSISIRNVTISSNSAHKFSLGSSLFVQVNLTIVHVDVCRDVFAGREHNGFERCGCVCFLGSSSIQIRFQRLRESSHIISCLGFRYQQC